MYHLPHKVDSFVCEVLCVIIHRIFRTGLFNSFASIVAELKHLYLCQFKTAESAEIVLSTIVSSGLYHDPIIYKLTLLKFIVNYYSVYTDGQLWTFELTPIPRVFYIKSKASGQVLTVPAGVKSGTLPTLASKRANYDPAQLWRFVPSAYADYRLIQNYSLDGPGAVLNCNGGTAGTDIVMKPRSDDYNTTFYVNV